MEPSPNRKLLWLRLAVLSAAMVTLVLLSADYSRKLVRQSHLTRLYSFDHNLWKALGPLPARLVDLGAQFDGALWLATDEGVFRFDGQWTACRDALRTKRAAALAANAGGVWVLDFEGNLSHFDGRAWTIQRLAPMLPGVSWGNAGQGIGLAAGSNGELWILRDGLWHYSDNRWAEVRPDGQEVIGARLVGESAGAVWLAREREVQAITPAGRIESRFPTDLPALAGRDIYRVVASGGKLWVATAGGFALFDGTSWQNVALPPQSGGILDAAPGSDTALFVVAGEPPAGIQARLKSALPLLLLSGLAAVLLVYVIYSFQRIRREGRQLGASLGGGWTGPRSALAVSRCREALNQGDYRRAMRNIQGLSFGLPSRQMLVLQAVVLSLGGMPEEAEQRCRRALGNGKSRSERFALDRLACVLMDLGRLAEGRTCLRQALDLDEGFDLACLDMAELILTEGGDAQRALEFVERAAEAKPSGTTHCVGRQTNAEIFAIRAWAFAAIGKRKDAEVCVQRTLDCLDQTCRPVVAGIYWRISRALTSLGDRNAATIHMRNAGLLDPQGKYGNLARAQIAQLSSSGVTA